MPQTQRVMFLATTDSYLKWALGLRQKLPDGWEAELAILKSLQNPSKRQISAALSYGQPEVIRSLHIISALRVLKLKSINLLIVAATGPSLVVIRWLLGFSKHGRTVKVVSGSPGIAFHLVGSPLRARAQADLILVSSTSEMDRFQAALDTYNPRPKLALATLPFLEEAHSMDRLLGKPTIVFATQPDIPSSRGERENLLLELATLAAKNPHLDVIVKLRAALGEPQTHFEKYPYETLAADLERRGRLQPGLLKFELGPLREFLKNANATLMTVSSTAALEALALGNRTHIVSNFGVSDEAANKVFDGSNLVFPISGYRKTSSEKTPSGWLEANYFHTPDKDDWHDALKRLGEDQSIRDFSLAPRGLKFPMFAAETIRILLPNAFGKHLLHILKALLGKQP